MQKLIPGPQQFVKRLPFGLFLVALGHCFTYCLGPGSLRCVYIHIYTYVYIYMCIYIYICKKERGPASSPGTYIWGCFFWVSVYIYMQKLIPGPQKYVKRLLFWLFLVVWAFVLHTVCAQVVYDACIYIYTHMYIYICVYTYIYIL